VTFPPPGPPPGPPGPPFPPPGPPPGPPPYWYSEPPTRQIPPQQVPLPQPEPAPPAAKRWLGDPLSIVLVLVTVAALALAALLGAELYARHKANTIVAAAVGCVVKDTATASFGIRPFLLQHFSQNYHDMTVETAGNQIREAKGMKLRLRLDDIRINQTAESAGTLGALDADVTWSAEGIKDTVGGIVPFLGGLVTGVSTEPSDGTIEVQGALGTLTIQPAVADGKLALNVVALKGLGLTLPAEAVQPAMDAFTAALTNNLPMGIRADSVAVTDTGVNAKFVTRDATIPNGQQDPCFAGI